MTFILSSLFGALTGGGTAAGAATAGAGVAAGSGGFTLLQGVGTAFSALATIGQARAQSQALKAQAAEEEFRARDEFIQGQEQQARLKKELALTVQRQSVAFASGGVDLSSGSVAVARDQAIDDAERELGVAANDALRNTFARRRQARNLRAEAKNVMAAGVASAFIPVFKFTSGVIGRG